MRYKIKYLAPVDEYLNSVSITEQRKILRQLKYIQEYGLRPEVFNLKKLKGYDFWEVRILGKHNTRIFCFQQGKIVYILHVFRKTSRKTSQKDLNRAERILKQLKA